MIVETVPEALAGERVDRAVAMMTGCSRREAVALIEAGAVRHNGRPVRKPAERLDPGDVVEVDDDELRVGVTIEADPTVEFTIVHEDDHVVVVDKPADLVVHPGAGTPSGTLVNGLVARYPEILGVGDGERPGVVHRLDKGTTGLLMVARTDAARDELSGQLAMRSVERRYVTVVWGLVEADHGMIDAAIGRSRRQPTRMAVVAEGREARTRYEVVSRHQNPAEVTVLRCHLDTGRTHQIRVHCSAIGHPVVGDETYGGRRDALPFGRPALHAEVLGFTHPATGERLRFESALPDDMRDLIGRLG